MKETPWLTIHTGSITIPGAKMKTLQQAFHIEYGKETRGIDVLVVAGLNNILRGHSGEALMRKIDLFRNTVMKQSAHFHPKSPNSAVHRWPTGQPLLQKQAGGDAVVDHRAAQLQPGQWCS